MTRSATGEIRRSVNQRAFGARGTRWFLFAWAVFGTLMPSAQAAELPNVMVILAND